MGLSIDVDDVTFVMIAGVWHAVMNANGKSTFTVSGYTYVEQRPGDAGCQVHPSGALGGDPEPGFAFQSTGREWVAGPLSAVQAVKYAL